MHARASASSDYDTKCESRGTTISYSLFRLFNLYYQTTKFLDLLTSIPWRIVSTVAKSSNHMCVIIICYISAVFRQ